MNGFLIFVIAVVSLVLLIWTSRHLAIRHERRHGFLLVPEHARDEAGLPRVSVVVAAKDEQDNIGACVQSMLEQDYPDFVMIVANDRSTDRTAEIVQTHAAQDARVRLLNIGDLPAGWYGKSHAMQKAIAASDGEWICMIDADCRQTSPRSLRAAVCHALDTGADLLSVLPTLEMKGFWENVVQPVCGGIMMIWYKPEKVNRPGHPQAYANGAFMLMKRSAYETIGGHEAVRRDLSEDMSIAARTKQAGLNLRVVRNRGLYLVRMYTSLKAILQGWSRIFLGTFGTGRRLAISLAALLVMGLLPCFAAATGLIALAAGADPAGPLPAMVLAALAAVAMQASVIYRFYRLIGARADLAWTYPIGCAMAAVAILISLTKLRKGAELTWRNTTYTRPEQADG